MKRRWYILPVAALAASAWWVTQQAENTVSAVQTVYVGTSPAAYPADMWERAARVHDIVIEPSAALPPDIPTCNGEGQAEIGDPAAKKGGTVRLCNAGPFPANFLAFGSPQPQFFHYNLFERIDIPLVATHPVSGEPIPGVAQQWAKDGDTLWFYLNPAARYTNGRPVRAADYALGALLRAETAYAEHQALLAAVSHLRIHGEHLLSVKLRRPMSADEVAALLHPAEPSFYNAPAGSDFRSIYANRVPPSTGAYTIGRVERGRMIELRRIKDWWAKDLPFYRNRFNVDSIEHHFLTDEAQVWEFLKKGKIDAVQTRNIAAWHRYQENPLPHLNSYTFRADYPMPPYGIAFNAKRLSDKNLRRGLMHAMDMDKAVELILRGEGERLRTFSTGYGKLTPNDTPVRAFSASEARAAFGAAGYTQRGADGILCRADGTRLSLSLAYTPSDKISALVQVLVQSAADCGAEIVPIPASWQEQEDMRRKGEHELLFWATMPSSPKPKYERFFAPDTTGSDAPFGVNDAELNQAMADYAENPTAGAVARIDKRLAELDIWLPGWKENLVCLVSHAHIRFPDSENCRFSTPAPFDVMEAHLYWIEP